jgi:aryl-phospho-beta-D-glucosidase BglC (GH1 family)
MAYVMDSLSLRGFRLTHLEQLRAYLDYRENDKCYYGNKEQYYKRHEFLVNWLDDAIEEAKKEGVKFPPLLKDK